jgi:hypothetical protein
MLGRLHEVGRDGWTWRELHTKFWSRNLTGTGHVRGLDVCRWEDTIEMDLRETECKFEGVDWRRAGQGSLASYCNIWNIENFLKNILHSEFRGDDVRTDFLLTYRCYEDRNPGLYSRGLAFDYWPGRRVYWLKVSLFSSLLDRMRIPNKLSINSFPRVPCYKLEGRGFDSRWGHWIFQLT